MNAPAKPATDELLEAFWERGLILVGRRVREEYGLNTPLFIDLRHKLYDDLETLPALGRALQAKIAELAAGSGRPQQVIGIPDTATPLALAAALASRGSEVPLVYGQLRKQPAAYPGGEWGVSAYMGTRDSGREVTLIDDVMASGRSKIWAIEQLAVDKIEVTRILVVVNREQGGEKILAAQGRPVHHLYTASSLLDYYQATGRISAAAAREVREHLSRKRFA